MKILSQILVLFGMLSISGCALERDVTTEPRFRSLLGNRFSLSEDCYVVKWREPFYLTYIEAKSPLLIQVKSGAFWDIPTAIDPSTFNKWHDYTKTLGVIKAGSTFKTTGIRYHIGLGDYTFLVAFEDPASSKWGVLDAGPIGALSPTPKISDKVARSLNGNQ